MPVNIYQCHVPCAPLRDARQHVSDDLLQATVRAAADAPAANAVA